MTTFKTLIVATSAALTIAAAGAAQAGSKHENDRRGDDYYASRGWCPPGLAKKHNGCMPPGQAKKARIGDHYWDYDYKRVDRRDDRYDFFRIGDVVVSADRKTGRILHLFDALGHELE